MCLMEADNSPVGELGERGVKRIWQNRSDLHGALPGRLVEIFHEADQTMGQE